MAATMRVNGVCAALFVVAFGACAATPRPSVMTVPGVSGRLAALGWLAGSWWSTTSTGSSEEHWMVPSSNLMLGMNRAVAGGVAKHDEHLRIEVRPDGVFYVASPSGQATTAFALVELTEFKAVFENPNHDYPKRITYQRAGDTLTVRIEGAAGDRVATWRWRRAALPAD